MLSNQAYFQEIDQERAPNTINGVAWGGHPRILARSSKDLLIWVPGQAARTVGFGHPYRTLSSMRVVPRNDHGWRQMHSGLICEGERYHKRVFTQYGAKIDSFFEDGVHQLLDTKKTLVIGDNASFSKYGHELPVTGREFGYEYVMAVAAKRERLIAEGITGVELAMRCQDVHNP